MADNTNTTTTSFTEKDALQAKLDAQSTNIDVFTNTYQSECTSADNDLAKATKAAAARKAQAKVDFMQNVQSANSQIANIQKEMSALDSASNTSTNQ